MNRLNDFLKPLDPINKFLYLSSLCVLFFILGVDVVCMFMPNIDTNELITVIVNFLDIMPNINGDTTDDYAN